MFKIGDFIKCIKSCYPHFTENKVYVVKEMHIIDGKHIVEAEATDNGDMGIGYHMEFFVMLINTPPKPPQCNCSGYDLFHKGHTCGLVKSKQWGLR
jgi:hypothetical protein